MSIFHLEITEHKAQFGETANAEGLVIAALLHHAAQRMGSGVPIGDVDSPEPLLINGVKVGRFWIGDGAHRGRRG